MKKEEFLKIDKNINNFERIKGIKSIPVIIPEVSEPKISFVIPTFNRPETLCDTLNSIFRQQKSSILYEVIVVDNSGNHTSNNKTFQLLQTYQDARLGYYQNDVNLGFEGNFNRAIELARGEWVSFIHDDDLITDDYLERVDFLLKKYDGDRKTGYIKTEVLTFSDMNALPDKKEVFKEKGLFAKKTWNCMKKITHMDSLIQGYSPTCIPSCGTLIRRKAIMEIGGFNPDYYPSFDAYPGYQMIGKYRVYMTYEPLGYYRWSINVSLKKETILGFLEANLYFREYLYSKNIFSKIYGNLLGEAYYSKNVDDWVKKANEHGVKLKIEEIEYIHPYKECKLGKKTIVLLQKVFNKYKKIACIVCREKV